MTQQHVKRGARFFEADGIGPRLHALVFFGAVLLFVLRRPDAIFHAQFYGEDGTVWYAEAYNLGSLHSLLIPHTGYFQTLPRAIASLSLLAPLRWAPLIMNAVAIALQVIPINFLLTSRCANWGPLATRAMLAFAYLVLPNSAEVDASITEGQWHLALLASLVVLAAPALTLAWQVFDAAVILLSGLTGPFCLLLLPIAVVFAFVRRNAWRAVTVGLLATTAVLQAAALFRTAGGTRSPAMLGATPKLFLVLIAGRVYLGAIIGKLSLEAQQHLPLLLLAFVFGTLILVYTAVRAPLELRLFLLFVALLFAAALRNPMVSLNTPQWQVLSTLSGARYWFFPTVGFVWSVIWCWRAAPSRPLQYSAAACALIMIIGVRRDWKYPPYGKEVGFRKSAALFASLPPGAMISLPIFPAGWSMRLTKHVPGCTLPIGAIDVPQSGATFSAKARVGGWAMAAGHKVEQIAILIDGQPAATSNLTIVRPDVDVAYPGSPDSTKGWDTTMDLTGYSPGKHQIEAWAEEVGGCKGEIGAVSIVKTL